MENMGQDLGKTSQGLRTAENGSWHFGSNPPNDPLLRNVPNDSTPSWQFLVHENPYVRCELCDYETTEAQLKKLPGDGACPECGGHEWIPISAKTAADNYFYHVAPTSVRDSIAKRGLLGHLKGETTSPWQRQREKWNPQRQPQPAGNYMFNNVDDARDYAIGHPNTPPYETNDEARNDMYNHGIEIGEDGSGWVTPEPPEGFHEWEPEAQDDWYDHAADNAVPFDHNNPEHLSMLPHRGMDIWKVHPQAVHNNLMPDPENAIVHQHGWTDPAGAIDEMRQFGPGDSWHEDANTWQDWGDPDTPLRYWAPGPIRPQHIQLAEWMPPWAATNEENMNRMDGSPEMTQMDTESYEREHPDPMNRIHPTTMPLSPPQQSLVSKSAAPLDWGQTQWTSMPCPYCKSTNTYFIDQDHMRCNNCRKISELPNLLNLAQPGGRNYDTDWFMHSKTAAWNTRFTNQLGPIAQAYNAAPMYDPHAAQAWQELAADSKQRADQLRQQYRITETDNPEPYPDAHAMFRDLDQGRFAVSRANSEHPIWTPDQNVNFRIVHDVLGHYPSGGDFSWNGENHACASHFPLLSPQAQRALFTECIAQTAYANHYKGFGPQKTAFLDQFIQPAQQAEGQPGRNWYTGSQGTPSGGFCHRHIRHGVYGQRLNRLTSEQRQGGEWHAVDDMRNDPPNGEQQRKFPINPQSGWKLAGDERKHKEERRQSQTHHDAEDRRDDPKRSKSYRNKDQDDRDNRKHAADHTTPPAIQTYDLQDIPDSEEPISEWDLIPDETYQGRQPIIYDGRNNVLHIGPNDYTHGAVARAAMARGHTIGRPSYGWIGENPESYNDDLSEIGGREYGWYMGSPGEHVDNAIAKHFTGVDKAPEDLWHFGAMQGDWQKGDYGKAVVEPQFGDVFAYRVSSTGSPHHLDIAHLHNIASDPDDGTITWAGYDVHPSGQVQGVINDDPHTHDIMRQHGFDVYEPQAGWTFTTALTQGICSVCGRESAVQVGPDGKAYCAMHDPHGGFTHLDDRAQNINTLLEQQRLHDPNPTQWFAAELPASYPFPEEEFPRTPTWHDVRPIIEHGEQRWIGEPGEYHPRLVKRLGIPPEIANNARHGIVKPSGEEVWYDEPHWNFSPDEEPTGGLPATLGEPVKLSWSFPTLPGTKQPHSLYYVDANDRLLWQDDDLFFPEIGQSVLSPDQHRYVIQGFAPLSGTDEMMVRVRTAKLAYDPAEPHGYCGEYAQSLHQLHPELSVGYHYLPPTQTEASRVGHIFLHDDTHAYDAYGKHPLPYDWHHFAEENEPNWQTIYNAPDSPEAIASSPGGWDFSMHDTSIPFVDYIRQHGDPVGDQHDIPHTFSSRDGKRQPIPEPRPCQLQPHIQRDPHTKMLSAHAELRQALASYMTDDDIQTHHGMSSSSTDSPRSDPQGSGGDALGKMAWDLGLNPEGLRTAKDGSVSERPGNHPSEDKDGNDSQQELDGVYIAGNGGEDHKFGSTKPKSVSKTLVQNIDRSSVLRPEDHGEDEHDHKHKSEHSGNHGSAPELDDHEDEQQDRDRKQVVVNVSEVSSDKHAAQYSHAKPKSRPSNREFPMLWSTEEGTDIPGENSTDPSIKLGNEYSGWNGEPQGKGMIDRNGGVHIWPIDRDGNPHHPWDAPHTFWFDYDGDYDRYEIHNAGGHLDKIRAAHPLLNDAVTDDMGWNFGSHTSSTPGQDWTPGTLGKGFVDENDVPHAWTIDDRHGTDGYPAHYEYASNNGLEPRSFYQVNPDGSYERLLDTLPEDDNAMAHHLGGPYCAGCGSPVELDLTHEKGGAYNCPNCKWQGTYHQSEPEDWHFGSEDSPYPVSWHGDPAYTDKREQGLYPVAFDGNRVMIGHNGLHHWDILHDPSSGINDLDDHSLGIVNPGEQLQSASGEWSPGSVEWLSDMHGVDHDAMGKTLSQAFGTPIKSLPVGQWKFGSLFSSSEGMGTPPGLKPWELGEVGKGTYVNGKPYAWADIDYPEMRENPIVNELNVHHWDAANLVTHPEEGNPDRYLYIDPNGMVQSYGERPREEASEFASHHPDMRGFGDHGEWKFGASEPQIMIPDDPDPNYNPLPYAGDRGKLIWHEPTNRFWEWADDMNMPDDADYHHFQLHSLVPELGRDYKLAEGTHHFNISDGYLQPWRDGTEGGESDYSRINDILPGRYKGTVGYQGRQWVRNDFEGNPQEALQPQWHFGSGPLIQNGGHNWVGITGRNGGVSEPYIPGQTFGKGLVTPDGTFHMWEPGPGGSPHHDEILTSLGYNMEEYRPEHDVYHNSPKFEMNPKGEIISSEPPLSNGQLGVLMREGLKPNSDVWHFGAGPLPIRYCPQCGVALTSDGRCTNPSCQLYNQPITAPEDPRGMPIHPDPWMDNEPGTLTIPQHWAANWLTPPRRTPYQVGTEGKGLTMLNGDHYRWQTDNGFPHHEQVERFLPGRVEQYHDYNEAGDDMLSSNFWNMSKTARQVIEMPDAGWTNTDHDDQPFVVHPDNGNVYVGAPGSYHQEIIDHPSFPPANHNRDEVSGLPSVITGIPNGIFNRNEGRLMWYEQPSDEAEQMIRKHFNAPQGETVHDDAWHFGGQYKYTCPECKTRYTEDSCPNCGYTTTWEKVAVKAPPAPQDPETYMGGLTTHDGSAYMFVEPHSEFMKRNQIDPKEVSAYWGWTPLQKRWINYADTQAPVADDYHFGAEVLPHTTVHDAYEPMPLYTDRRPVIYIPDRDELHVGGRGDPHGAIYQRIDPDYDDESETWNGYFHYPGNKHGMFPQPGQFGWFDNDNPTHDGRILQAIKQNIPDIDEVEAQDPNQWSFKGKADPDELHVGLEIPNKVKKDIHQWAKEQDWPEGTDLESPDEYHITLLFAPEGHSEHHDANWIHHSDGHPAEIVGLDEFTNKDKPNEIPTVLKVKSDAIKTHANSLQAKAEENGLEVSKFPGGYKPHLTVAYGPGKPKDATHPKLKFKTGPSSVSTPRTKE